MTERKPFAETYTMRSRFYALLGEAGKLLGDAYMQADRANQQAIKSLIFEAMTHYLVEQYGYTEAEITGGAS